MRTWTDLNGSELVALNALGGEAGIYVLPAVIKMFKGDCSAAVYLHHLLYWSRSDAAKANDGWFYSTTQRTTTNVGIPKAVQERVRRKLIEMGLMEQKRVGLPAKNYYRMNLDNILEKIGQVMSAKLSSSSTETVQLDDDKAVTIVNKGEDTVSEDTVDNYSSLRTSEKNSSADAVMPKKSTGRNRAKLNVLGDQYDDYVNWVVQAYPKNLAGLGATHDEAVKAVNKLGDTFNDVAVPKAKQQMREFTEGIKNLAAAVADKSWQRAYVPNFANFAGIGIMYGKEPHYKKWAVREAPTPAPRKIMA